MIKAETHEPTQRPVALGRREGPSGLIVWCGLYAAYTLSHTTKAYER